MKLQIPLEKKIVKLNSFNCTELGAQMEIGEWKNIFYLGWQRHKYDC